MVIGVCRIVLSLPGNDSLKGKRAVVKRICERAKHRFGVSAAEVDVQDVHRRAVIAFAVVSNDARHAQSVLDKVLDFASGATEAVVVDERSEILRPSRLGVGGPEPSLPQAGDDLARWVEQHPPEEDDDGY